MPVSHPIEYKPSCALVLVSVHSALAALFFLIADHASWRTGRNKAPPPLSATSHHTQLQLVSFLAVSVTRAFLQLWDVSPEPNALAWRTGMHALSGPSPKGLSS